MRGKRRPGVVRICIRIPECGDWLLLQTSEDISEDDLPHAGADPRWTARRRPNR